MSSLLIRNSTLLSTLFRSRRTVQSSSRLVRFHLSRLNPNPTSSGNPTMAPKRKAIDSSAESTQPPPPSSPSKTTKKPKKEKALNSLSAPNPEAADQPAPDGIARNVTVPGVLNYQKRPENQIRIASWNITSLNSSKTKGLFTYIEAEDADVLILSETKINELKPVEMATDMQPLRDRYPFRYWGIGEKKGYAGVAILSKVKPLSKEIGLPGLSGVDSKGRLITLEFENTYIVGTYVVNAGEGLKSMPEKKKWNAAFAAHLAKLDSKKPVIWGGDLNVVLDQRDLSAAKAKWNKSPGYTEEECEAHRAILNGTHQFAEQGLEVKKFKDVWRDRFHPDEVGHYTFYGFRGKCREKGLGWRLDSFIASERIVEKFKQCEIRHEVYGASDHVPIFCDLEGPL